MSQESPTPLAITPQTILSSILAWSQEPTRPLWIRDALRRVVTGVKITPDIVEELKIMALAEAGYPDAQPIASPVPLSKEHISTASNDAAKVVLIKISDVNNINALCNGAVLNFSESGMTIVYGENGSGKSGFSRIIKQIGSCLSPQEEILPNAYKKDQKHPSCKIKYKIDNIELEHAYQAGSLECSPLRKVHTFDSKSTLSVISEKGYSSYLPFGLNYLDELANNICTEINNSLDRLKSSLPQSLPVIPDSFQGSPAHQYFINVKQQRGSPTEYLKMLPIHANFDEKGEQRIRDIDSLLSNDASSRAQKTRSFARRVRENFYKRISEFESTLCYQNFEKVNYLIENHKQLNDASKALSIKIFDDNTIYPIQNTGSKIWLALWKSAEQFAHEEAYTGTEYPSKNANRCVLCQQILDTDSEKRFDTFKKYANSNIKKHLEDIKKEKSSLLSALHGLKTNQDADNAILEDIAEYSQIFCSHLETYISSVEKFKNICIESLETNNKIESTPPLLPISDLNAFLKDIEEKASILENASNPEVRTKLSAEKRNLCAAKWLKENFESIKSEIQRQINIKKIEKAKFNTRSITTLSRNIFDNYINSAFIDLFNSEIREIGLTHLSIDVHSKPEKARFIRSILIKDTHNTNNSPSKILSEGEIKATSLAAFIAESNLLSYSSLVLDDPVTSLDHRYRINISKILAMLAKQKQIIIFTHDLLFLSWLMAHHNEECGSEPLIMSIYRDDKETGIPGKLPITSKAKRDINTIEQDLLNLQKIEPSNIDMKKAFESKICKDMRLITENFIENNLLQQIVKRFRVNIITKGKINKLTNITVDHVNFIENCMSKYSIDLHPHGGESPPSLPSISTIKNDIIRFKELLKIFP